MAPLVDGEGFTFGAAVFEAAGVGVFFSCMVATTRTVVEVGRNGQLYICLLYVSGRDMYPTTPNSYYCFDGTYTHPLTARICDPWLIFWPLYRTGETPPHWDGTAGVVPLALY